MAKSVAVVVSASTVTISSATPGGEILLLGFNDRFGRSARRFRTYNVALTAASSGDVTWIVPGPVEPATSWIAIDVDRGEYAVTGDGKLKDATLSPERIKKDKDGHWRRLEPALPYAQIVVARAKRGSWHISAGDGGPRDRDGLVDGKIEVDIADLEPTGKASGKLAKLEPDDLVLIIDPETPSILTRRVSGK